MSKKKLSSRKSGVETSLDVVQKELSNIGYNTRKFTEAKVSAIYQDLIGRTADELKSISEDSTQPIYYRIIARILLKDLKNHSFFGMAHAEDRAFGSITQKTKDITPMNVKPIKYVVEKIELIGDINCENKKIKKVETRSDDE